MNMHVFFYLIQKWMRKVSLIGIFTLRGRIKSKISYFIKYTLPSFWDSIFAIIFCTFLLNFATGNMGQGEIFKEIAYCFAIFESPCKCLKFKCVLNEWAWWSIILLRSIISWTHQILHNFIFANFPYNYQKLKQE